MLDMLFFYNFQLPLFTQKKKFTGGLSRFVLFVYIKTRFYIVLYCVYVYKVK